MTASNGLVSAAHGHGTAMANLRRALRRRPETGLHTPDTQEQILNMLTDLPGRVVTGTALSSVVAVIHGEHPGGPGGTVLLRVGTDAATSTGPADGYAVHAAALAGAAWLLADHRRELHGSVVLAWQPGCGSDGGAQLMLEEGLLNAAGQPVDAAYGLRTLPGMPRGVVAVRAGSMLAACEQLHITVSLDGLGGGARPTASPVTVACQIASTMDRLRLDTRDPVAVTVDRIATTRADDGAMPDTATITAVVRTRGQATRRRLVDAVTRLSTGYATAYGMHATCDLDTVAPAVNNYGSEVEWVVRAVTDLFGRDRLCELPAPVAMRDDFGAILTEVPGAMVLLLGAVDGDDGLLPPAAALLAGIAVRRLAARRLTPPAARRRAHLSLVSGEHDRR